jgi:predicted alpha/beta-hydrolase family hydrolase
MGQSEVTPFQRGNVRGYLHRPDPAYGGAIVLTHGAGGDCGGPLLVALSNAFCATGMLALRCDLPFRQRRAKGPPSPAGAAEDRAGLQSAVLALREIASGLMYLGGQSYGGRQASMLAAEDSDLVAGLLLLSYPLHPPGKPEQLRTQHFPLLRVPAIFVQGTADPFGSIAELRSATSAIPTPHQIFPIENAGHDLKRGRFDLTSVVEAVRLLGG